MKGLYANQITQSDRRRPFVAFDLGIVAAIFLALIVPSGMGDQGGAETEQTKACAFPDALSAADEDKAARKAYVKVLEADPSSKCASDGLAKLNAPAAKSATDSCKLGDAYLKVHRDDDAIEAFKKGLEAEPGAECASNGLKDVGPGFFSRGADKILDSITTLLIWLGLLLLVLLLFLLGGYWPPAKRLMQRPRVVGRWISRLLSPKLTFEALADDCVDGKPGAPIVARIKMLLAQMREEVVSRVPPEYDLDFGTPREQFADLVSADKGLKNSLDNASDISEQTKVVAALLNLVYAMLPIQRFEISGCLEPPAASAAVSLVLEEDAELRAGTTVKRPASSGGSATAVDYMNLVEPAAIWIQFEVARAIERKPPDVKAAESQALLHEGLRH